MPKIKGIRFDTAIIEPYRRGECSIVEAHIEMYLAGVSVRRVEDITEVSGESRSLMEQSAIAIKKLMNISKHREAVN